MSAYWKKHGAKCVLCGEPLLPYNGTTIDFPNWPSGPAHWDCQRVLAMATSVVANSAVYSIPSLATAHLDALCAILLRDRSEPADLVALSLIADYLERVTEPKT